MSAAAAPASALYPQATSSAAGDIPSNPRGIPAAPFIVRPPFLPRLACRAPKELPEREADRPRLPALDPTAACSRQANVEEHIGGPDGDCEGALRKFQEMSASVPPFPPPSLPSARRVLNPLLRTGERGQR